MRSRRLPFPHHLLGWAALLAIATHASATPYFWSNGAFGVLGLPNPMVAPDTLTIPAGGVKSFTALTWTNESVVSHVADRIFGGSATLNNGGFGTCRVTARRSSTTSGNRPVFVNTGTLRKSAGTIDQLRHLGLRQQRRRSRRQVGVLNFNSGVGEHQRRVIVPRAGTVRMSAGAAFNGGFVADNLEFAGGTFSRHCGPADRRSGRQRCPALGREARSREAGNSMPARRWWRSTAPPSSSSPSIWSTAAPCGGSRRTTCTAASSTLTNNGLFEAQANSRLVYNAGNRPVFVNNGTLRAADGVTLDEPVVRPRQQRRHARRRGGRRDRLRRWRQLLQRRHEVHRCRPEHRRQRRALRRRLQRGQPGAAVGHLLRR